MKIEKPGVGRPLFGPAMYTFRVEFWAGINFIYILFNDWIFVRIMVQEITGQFGFQILIRPFVLGFF